MFCSPGGPSSEGSPGFHLGAAARSMLSLAALAAIATRALDSSSQASIVAAARRSRVRERQSSQRLREAASVPSGQLAGIVPDDVFRDTAIREGLASNLQEMERRRAEEQAIWAASEHDAAFAAARAALSRQSWPLSSRQCGPPAVEAVRAATAECAPLPLSTVSWWAFPEPSRNIPTRCAREYLALHGELLRALEYCAPLQRGDVLHAAAATRFGAAESAVECDTPQRASRVWPWIRRRPAAAARGRALAGGASKLLAALSSFIHRSSSYRRATRAATLAHRLHRRVALAHRLGALLARGRVRELRKDQVIT